MNATRRSTSHLLALTDLQEAIRRRAEEIYIQSGKVSGRDLENWSQAEREIMSKVGNAARRTAVIVRVNGIEYVGEYEPERSEGYIPGEFASGGFVPVRFEGDKMFVTRPNGKELETTIVEKIG